MTRTIAALFVLGLCLIGCTPKPFDPATDCVKEPSCGQCTAQAGCAWCGNECFGIGRKPCDPGMVRKPEGCPGAASSASASPSATANASVSPGATANASVSK